MKIMHISDLHFGYHNDTILAHFFADLTEINPDIILISGDLTQRAKTEQFAMVHAFLQQLPGKVLLVPGNHDIPFNMFSRFFNPFKNFHHFTNSQATATYLDNEVRILGVNTVNPYAVKDGWMSSATLDLIRDYFSSAFSGLNILFFHHNFDYQEGWHKPLENYQTFIDYLKQSAINLVCTGHLHYANVNLLEKQDETACVLLHAGSLLCPRTRDGINSYYLITSQAHHATVTWRIFANNSFITQTSYNIDFTQEFTQLRTAIE